VDGEGAKLELERLENVLPSKIFLLGVFLSSGGYRVCVQGWARNASAGLCRSFWPQQQGEISLTASDGKSDLVLALRQPPTTDESLLLRDSSARSQKARDSRVSC
jgi:hypothetical protein